ncbi:PEP-CTERM sorting domain-containing protein [Chitinibacter tainanensis]|uniref:PEP-CTERM sorting domain-containing protein n=1 Tax=Chitinibacter tainanensis TaxID=230667 RepID=UPI002356CA32|nr:PEP-CTERM sorting domain-containing protein [Chitinibacter tainanensis]
MIKPLLSAIAATLLISSPAQATVVEQWATQVVGFSSQYGTNNWSAAQALGAPNTNSYGDIGTAWATLNKNNGMEFITLAFANPVHSVGALIRETYGNGFVTQIDALDAQGKLHTVWQGIDTSQPGQVVDFRTSWQATSFLTHALKIHVNTNHNLNAWEEIDAVQLQGVAPVPEPETYALMGLGLLSLAMARRKQRG